MNKLKKTYMNKINAMNKKKLMVNAWISEKRDE